MNDSKDSTLSARLPGLHKLTSAQRIHHLQERGWLTRDDAQRLLTGRQVLTVAAADRMVENVIGTFGMPLAVAPNFIVNGREHLVPLVVEEPSVVAALSSAAALARETGGFTAEAEDSLLCGQVHLIGVTNVKASIARLEEVRDQLLEQANRVHPRLLARGGGVRNIIYRSEQLPDGKPLLIVHILVDTCDAMGANMVNTICESIAPDLARIADGDVVLRILSNLTDESLAKASVRYPLSALTTTAMPGATVRDRIVSANDIALSDAHRAATHNKGIMNGIDSLAIATGNDWRALEAAAHAFAACSGRYQALTRWSVGASGNLVGEIEIPIKVGVVGGTISSNPAAQLGLELAGAESAQHLAELMAAVGLAQNFSAIRALVTSGIQEGHMRLHARSAIPDVAASTPLEGAVGTAAGKVILVGEHAVVYGQPAVALPIPDAVRATVQAATENTTLTVPGWHLHLDIAEGGEDSAAAAVNLIAQQLGVAEQHFAIHVDSALPRGAGLGSSAAFAVAIVRAIANHCDMQVDTGRVNEIAFACEKLAHGTPSGLDNTVASFAEAMTFQTGDASSFKVLDMPGALPFVIAFSPESSPTHQMIAGVRERYQRQTAAYEQVFRQIGALSRDAEVALQRENIEGLGGIMNVCHGLLNAIGVSTPALEQMVAIARGAGAIGAKLTGGGGGGAMLALCPGRQDQVRSALLHAGFQVLNTNSNKGLIVD